TFGGLRDQAGLQLIRQRSGTLEWRALAVEPGRGLGTLPPRSPGAAIRAHALGAHDREGEGKAVDALVDLIHARLDRYPDLHVYHFSGSEPSTLKRLMAEHVTREMEVDDLLRRRVFVDLHTIVRRALRAGVPSYSLKDLEALFGFRRAGAVNSGTQAILTYERWLLQQSQPLLDEIAAYNLEDCRATLGLLEWLHE